MGAYRSPNGHSACQTSVTNHPEWYHCPRCGKRTYSTRKDARRIARRMVSGQRASAYECAPDTGRWHVGRLAPTVVYGRATRGDLYGQVSA